MDAFSQAADDYIKNQKPLKLDVSDLLERIRPAIFGQESSGNYNVGSNPRTGATGGYQVLPTNIPAWTQKHYGQALTPSQFKGNKQAQDAVFNGEMGDYLRRAKAKGVDDDTALRMGAAQWYGGPGAIDNYDSTKRPAPKEPSQREYTTSVLKKAGSDPFASAASDYLKNPPQNTDPFEEAATNYLSQTGSPTQPVQPSPTVQGQQTLKTPEAPSIESQVDALAPIAAASSIGIKSPDVPAVAPQTPVQPVSGQQRTVQPQQQVQQPQGVQTGQVTPQGNQPTAVGLNQQPLQYAPAEGKPVEGQEQVDLPPDTPPETMTQYQQRSQKPSEGYETFNVDMSQAPQGSKEQFARGQVVNQIAQKYGVSPLTVQDALNKHRAFDFQNPDKNFDFESVQGGQMPWKVGSDVLDEIKQKAQGHEAQFQESAQGPKPGAKELFEQLIGQRDKNYQLTPEMANEIAARTELTPEEKDTNESVAEFVRQNITGNPLVSPAGVDAAAGFMLKSGEMLSKLGAGAEDIQQFPMNAALNWILGTNLTGTSTGNTLGKLGNRFGDVNERSTPEGEKLYTFTPRNLGNVAGSLVPYALVGLGTAGNPILTFGATDFLTAKGEGKTGANVAIAGGKGLATGFAIGGFSRLGKIFGDAVLGEGALPSVVPEGAKFLTPEESTALTAANRVQKAYEILKRDTTNPNEAANARRLIDKQLEKSGMTMDEALKKGVTPEVAQKIDEITGRYVARKIIENAVPIGTAFGVGTVQAKLEGADNDKAFGAGLMFGAMQALGQVFHLKPGEKFTEEQVKQADGAVIRVPDEQGKPHDLLLSDDNGKIKVVDATGKVPPESVQSVVLPKPPPEVIKANAEKFSAGLTPDEQAELTKAPKANIEKPTEIKAGDKFAQGTVVETRGNQVLVEDDQGQRILKNKGSLTPVETQEAVTPAKVAETKPAVTETSETPKGAKAQGLTFEKKESDVKSPSESEIPTGRDLNALKATDQKDYIRKTDFLQGYLDLDKQYHELADRQWRLEADNPKYHNIESELTKIEKDIDIQVNQGAKHFKITPEDFVGLVNDYEENKSAVKQALSPTEPQTKEGQIIGLTGAEPTGVNAEQKAKVAKGAEPENVSTNASGTTAASGEAISRAKDKSIYEVNKQGTRATNVGVDIDKKNPESAIAIVDHKTGEITGYQGDVLSEKQKAKVKETHDALQKPEQAESDTYEINAEDLGETKGKAPEQKHGDSRYEAFARNLKEHPDRNNPNEYVPGKSAWEVRQKVWIELQPKAYQEGRAEGHKREVKQALEQGKPVPAEVLKDYPDLAKSALQPNQPVTYKGKTLEVEKVEGTKVKLKGVVNRVPIKDLDLRTPEQKAESERIVAKQRASLKEINKAQAQQKKGFDRWAKEAEKASTEDLRTFQTKLESQVKESYQPLNEKKLRIVKAELAKRGQEPLKSVAKSETDLSKQYDEAVAKRDRVEAQHLVNEIRGVKPIDHSFDRGGAHGEPGPDSGAPLWDVTNRGQIYPDDVYSMNGLHYYGTGEDAMDRVAWSLIQSYKGKPNRPITIYRAIEKDSPSKGIQPGEWVTPIRKYAVDHGKSTLNGDYRIQQKRVYARDIYTAGDSWLEWGYHPQPTMLPGLAPKRDANLKPTGEYKKFAERPDLHMKGEQNNEVQKLERYAQGGVRSDTGEDSRRLRSGDKGRGRNAEAPENIRPGARSGDKTPRREQLGVEERRDATGNKGTDRVTHTSTDQGRGARPDTSIRRETGRGSDDSRHDEGLKSVAKRDQTETPELLAPNGKPSKLPAHLHQAVRTKAFKDWFGDWESIAKKGDNVWNHDDVSKVVDANGEPLVVFHGTRADEPFKVFNDEHGNKQSDAPIGSTFFTNDKRVARSYSGNKPIFEAFLNIREPSEADFEGADWQGDAHGKIEARILEDGEDVDQLYTPLGGRFFESMEDVEKAADKAGVDMDSVDTFRDPFIGESTNSVVRDAQRYGNDGAIIRNVIDSGTLADAEYPADIYVVLKSSQIKSTANRGTFSPDEDSILKSVAKREDEFDEEDEESPRLYEEEPSRYSGDKVPDVSFSAKDLQDSEKTVNERTIRKDYGASKDADIYEGYIPIEDLPNPQLAEQHPEEGEEPSEYDWSALESRNRGVPPAKILIKPDGKLEILDGNHRIEFWDNSGYTHVPAWIIDERSESLKRIRDEQTDHYLHEVLPRKTGNELVTLVTGGQITDKNELELDPADAEYLRRLEASRTGKAVAVFDGQLFRPADFDKAIDHNEQKIQEALDAGISKADLKGPIALGKNLEKLRDIKKGVGIAYVYEDALPEERTHEEDILSGGIDAQATKVLTTSPFMVDAGKRFNSDYKGISKTNKLKEIFAKLATNQEKYYGWDKIPDFEAEKKRFLQQYARGILRKNNVATQAEFEAFTEQYGRIAAHAPEEYYAETKTGNAEGGITTSQETAGERSNVEGTGEGGQEAPEGESKQGEQAPEVPGPDVREGELKNRQYAQTLRENGYTNTPDVPYIPETEKGWRDKAQQIIAESKDDNYVSAIEAMDSKVLSEGEKTALGIALIDHLGSIGDLDRMSQVAQKTVLHVGTAAQALRASQIVGKYDFAAGVMMAERALSEAGRPMKPRILDKVKNKLGKVQVAVENKAEADLGVNSLKEGIEQKDAEIADLQKALDEGVGKVADLEAKMAELSKQIKGTPKRVNDKKALEAKRAEYEKLVREKFETEEGLKSIAKGGEEPLQSVAKQDLDPETREALTGLATLDILDNKTLVETLAHLDDLTGGQVDEDTLKDIHADAFEATEGAKHKVSPEAKERLRNRAEHRAMARETRGMSKKSGVPKPNRFEKEVMTYGKNNGYSDAEIATAILMPKMSGQNAPERLMTQIKASFKDADASTFKKAFELRQQATANIRQKQAEAKIDKEAYQGDLNSFIQKQRNASSALRHAKGEIEAYYKKLSRTMPQKLLHGASEAVSITKGLSAAWDISYPLRQGFIPLLTDTRAALKGDWKGIGHGLQNDNELWKFLANKGGFENAANYLSNHSLSNFVEQVREHPRFLEAQNSGIRFSTIGDFNIADDHFSTKMLDLLPLYKRTEAAYTLPGDLQRLYMYDNWSQTIDGLNLTPEQSAKAKKYAAETINAFTGKGDVGNILARGGALSKLANLSFFSPQLFVSRFQSAYRLGTGFATAPKGMKAIMMRKGLRFYGLMAGIAFLLGAGLASNSTDLKERAKKGLQTLDPDDDGFGKIDVNPDSPLGKAFPDAHIDFSAGMNLPIQIALRTGMGLVKSIANGDKGYFNDAMLRNWRDLAVSKQGEPRLLRGKLAPTMSLAVDAYTGKDFTGRPFSWWGGITGRTTPLAWQQTYDGLMYDRYKAMEKEPQTFENAKAKLNTQDKMYLNALGVMAGSFLGLGVTQYPRDEQSPATQLAQDLSTTTSNKDSETLRKEGALRNLLKTKIELMQKGQSDTKLDREIQSWQNQHPELMREFGKINGQAGSKNGLLSYYLKDLSAGELDRVLKIATPEEAKIIEQMISKQKVKAMRAR